MIETYYDLRAQKTVSNDPVVVLDQGLFNAMLDVIRHSSMEVHVSFKAKALGEYLIKEAPTMTVDGFAKIIRDQTHVITIGEMVRSNTDVLDGKLTSVSDVAVETATESVV